ncbi:MAG: histidinol-phosphatase HisJ family protein [Fusobacteria bacterium]|nr:histidinol-phosphatase HisJ family protein [Fusobacteriota bacterium]
MIKADCHLHSNFSPDSQENFDNIISISKQKGLEKIYITDHYEHENPFLSDPKDWLNLGNYQDEILKLKEIHQKELDIRLGIEFGMQPQIKAHLKEVAQKYPFDFIIASSHTICGHDVGFDATEYAVGKTQFQFYQGYFEEILACMENFSEFDVYGHIDYIIRYGKFETKDVDLTLHRDILEVIFKKLIENGKGIELNTSGTRYRLDQFHPKKDILKLYQSLGGEIITVGSDAHRAIDIGFEFSKAEELLQTLGFGYYTLFEKRKPIFQKLGK